MVGYVRLKVSGPAGTTVTIRHAEVLNPDGTLYTANLRSARATDYYTLRGEGEEVYEPYFTFHGFRYVELAGFPGTPTADAVTGIVLHSNIEPTGEFECSDLLINQLQRNIQWGQKGNFLDIPTDCPQRDERCGWTGDAQVFIQTAAFNRDVSGFFAKWLRDLQDEQAENGGIPAVAPGSDAPSKEADGGPAWADAVVICPWTQYERYGDLGLLAEHYDSLTRWMTQQEESSEGLIRIANGWQGFGDWLALDGSEGSGKWDGGTPKDLIGTAFFAHSARLMARIADHLDRAGDAEKYRRLAARIKEAFGRRFVTPDGLVVGGTQTSYVLALHFDLLLEDRRTAVVNALVRDIEERGNHLSTGFVGTPYLLHVLTRAGRLDVAYRLLFQKTWPSWLYPGHAGRDDNLGAVGRLDRRQRVSGRRDELLQSLRLRRGRRLAVFRRCRALTLTPPARLQAHFTASSPRRRSDIMPAPNISPRMAVSSSAWKIEEGRFHWSVAIPAEYNGDRLYCPSPDSPPFEIGSGEYEYTCDWSAA